MRPRRKFSFPLAFERREGSFCFNKKNTCFLPLRGGFFVSIRKAHVFFPSEEVSFSFFLFLFLPRLRHPRPYRPLYASDRASTAIGWKGLPLGEKG